MNTKIEQSNMYEVRTFSGFTGVWVNASNLKEAYQKARHAHIVEVVIPRQPIEKAIVDTRSA